MKFRVGQAVRIVRGARAGSVAQVTSKLFWGAYVDDITGEICEADVHSLDVAEDFVSRPDELEPYHEPGDFHSVSDLIENINSAPVKEDA